MIDGQIQYIQTLRILIGRSKKKLKCFIKCCKKNLMRGWATSKCKKTLSKTKMRGNKVTLMLSRLIFEVMSWGF